MDSRRDPLLVAAYAVASAAIVLLGLPSILAVVLVAPLVLLAPGLSLVMALRIDGDAVLPGRRGVTAVALSVAISAVGGILVNTVAPLTRTSWLVWLAGFTCLGCAIASLRGRRTRTTTLPRTASAVVDRLRVEGPWRWAAVGAVVLAALAGAATMTEITSRQAYDTPLTALSVQPAAGAGSAEVRLSVVNRSARAENLRLTIAGAGTSPMVTDLRVTASGQWTAVVRVGASGLHAVLTKAGRSAPIAQVSWSAAAAPARRRGRLISATSSR